MTDQRSTDRVSAPTGDRMPSRSGGENQETAAAAVNAALLGEITWLMMRSPVHRHLFLADLEWLVTPPLILKQSRLFRRDRVPVAFVSWGLLTDEVEQRVVNGVWRLQPGDWKAGDRLWVVDVVAPYGGLDAITEDLRKRVFPDRTFKVLRPASEGGRPFVEELRGVQVT